MSLLLLVAATASVLAFAQMEYAIAAKTDRLLVLRSLTQELIVHEPNKVTCVRRIQSAFGECIWDVHIPEGSNKALVLNRERLATLAPGKHVIEYYHSTYFDKAKQGLRVDGHRVNAAVNVLGMPFGGQDHLLYKLTSAEPDEPLVLGTFIHTVAGTEISNKTHLRIE